MSTVLRLYHKKYNDTFVGRSEMYCVIVAIYFEFCNGNNYIRSGVYSLILNWWGPATKEPCFKSRYVASCARIVLFSFALLLCVCSRGLHRRLRCSAVMGLYQL